MFKIGDRVIYYKYKRGYTTKKHAAEVVRLYEGRVRIKLTDGTEKVVAPENLQGVA